MQRPSYITIDSLCPTVHPTPFSNLSLTCLLAFIIFFPPNFFFPNAFMSYPFNHHKLLSKKTTRLIFFVICLPLPDEIPCKNAIRTNLSVHLFSGRCYNQDHELRCLPFTVDRHEKMLSTPPAMPINLKQARPFLLHTHHSSQHQTCKQTISYRSQCFSFEKNLNPDSELLFEKEIKIVSL